MPIAKNYNSGLSKSIAGTGSAKGIRTTTSNLTAPTITAATTSPTPTSGGAASGLMDVGNAISGQIGSLMTDIADLKNMGSAMANAASLQAQENQFAFNSAEAALARQYNTEMWEKNAAFNSAEAELNRQFQAKEAQTNRDWQERMANTAYQRQIADLKAAGLNPVIAALNGGAATGSGAQASGSQASSSPTSGSAASGSNYSGQGYNISDSLAMIGAIGTMIGAGVSAFGAWLADQRNLDTYSLKDVDWTHASTTKFTSGKKYGNLPKNGLGKQNYTYNGRRPA